MYSESYEVSRQRSDDDHISRKREFDVSNSNDSKEERRRKRKSRWANDESEKVIIPGMPTTLPTNLTPEQEKIYLLQLQIEEVTRRLRTGDLGIPNNPEERSPSPEPIYNSDGKRLNTREYRVRKRLEDERHRHIQKMLELNPTYKPPADYKPPQSKCFDKIIIPQEEYPDINFVGLLIGPRGNTLKAMERDSSAKIVIRGKGSVKEGKVSRKDGQPLPGEDEPLHAFITGPTDSSIQIAIREINKIIRQAIELPENQNNLRRSQLRELALLNGTLRENDSFASKICSNCGSDEHRNWQCPEKTNLVNTITCNRCGGKGHLQRDCKVELEPEAEGNTNQAKIDEEYLSLMAELGEAPPPVKSKPIYEPPQPVTTEPTSQSSAVDAATSVEQTTVNTEKSLTWIQKQGAWKQVMKETPIKDESVPPAERSSDSTVNSSVDPAAYYANYNKHLAAAGQIPANTMDPATAAAAAAQYAYSYYGYGAQGAYAQTTSASGTPAVANPYAGYGYAVDPATAAASYNYAAYYGMGGTQAAGAAASTGAGTTQPPPPPPPLMDSSHLPPPPPPQS